MAVRTKRRTFEGFLQKPELFLSRWSADSRKALYRAAKRDLNKVESKSWRKSLNTAVNKQVFKQRKIFSQKVLQMSSLIRLPVLALRQ